MIFIYKSRRRSMKKTALRMLALCLAVVVMACALVSCGKLAGVYENNTFGLVTTYTFSGNKYTRTMSGISEYDSGITASGTYSISDGKIHLSPENGHDEILSFSKSGKTIYIADMEFEKK